MIANFLTNFDKRALSPVHKIVSSRLELYEAEIVFFIRGIISILFSFNDVRDYDNFVLFVKKQSTWRAIASVSGLYNATHPDVIE